MKHRYFGNAADYQKYGLLRRILEERLRLSVCWMLTPDDGSPSPHGLDYLSRPNLWRRFDPELFDALGAATAGGAARSLRHAEALLSGARFFDDPPPAGALDRERWFANSLSALSGSDVLFFDPDVGIEPPSVRIGAKDSTGYLLWREIVGAWRSGASLVVFQHFPRTPRAVFVNEISRRLAEKTPGSWTAALPMSQALFLFAIRSEHRERVESAIYGFRRSWGDRAGVLQAIGELGHDPQ